MPSWLKKVGSIALKATDAIPVYGPLLKAFLPAKGDQIVDRVIDKSHEFAGVIIQVEAVGEALGIKGPDKLKAAAPLIAQVILQSSFMVGKKIANPDLFKQGCTEIGGGWADVMNSLHEDSE